MLFGLLITDGGPHPPEKLAGWTAAQIIDIANTAPALLYDEARRFEAAVTNALQSFHGLVQTDERAALEQSSDRLIQSFEHHGHAQSAAGVICGIAAGLNDDGSPRFSTTFREHFSKSETRAYLEALLREHFHHNAWIERSWHADANLNHPAAKVFTAVRDNGHAVLRQSDDDLEPHGGREVVVQMVARMNPHFGV